MRTFCSRIKIAMLVLLVVPLSLFAAIQPPAVLSLHFVPGDTVLHLNMTLSRPSRVKVFRLQHPSRIVLDFEGVRMKASLKNTGLPLPGISQIRKGYPKPGVLRIVLEVDPSIRFHLRSPLLSDTVRLDLTPWKGSQVARPKATSKATPKATLTESHEPPRPLVVIVDPGHGGHDPGARGVGGTREKDIVLSIARQLAAEINQTEGMRAVMTRDRDYFVPLRGRLERARHGRGDLFVSVHADSWFDHDARGASVYALSRHGATSEAARWLAGRENDSELAGVNLRELADQSVVLRSVLIDLAQTATIQDSLRLGASVLHPIRPVAGLHYRHVEQAPFMVLKSPDIPSILVETGFLSNRDEEQRLRDPGYQARIAHAIYQGITEYLKKYPPALAG